MKRLSIAVILTSMTILIALNYVTAQTADNSNVIWQIEPQYDSAGSFSEGLAFISIDSKMGYINREGVIVIKPQFYLAYDFSEGFARVVKKPEGNYLINREGIPVIGPYYVIDNFSEGMAKFQENNVHGFVNKSGVKVIYPTPGYPGIFSEDLVSINTSEDFSGGFINKEGKIVIKPQYNWREGNFSEGLLPVKNKKDGFYFYINKKGRTVIETKFEGSSGFSEGMAGFKLDGKCGYIDKKGKVVIPAKFRSANDFSEGLGMVVDEQFKHCYVNKKGKIIIETTFYSADNFCEGLALVKDCKKDMYGYIDKDGKVVITPQFKYAYGFSEGLALVQKDGRYGYIKNPLPVKKQEQSFDSAGLSVGKVKSVNGPEIMVAGKNASDIYTGDELCLFTGEKVIFLLVISPEKAGLKCENISGNPDDVKPGTKVYKYKRIKKTD